jgi:hypothetical protein
LIQTLLVILASICIISLVTRLRLPAIGPHGLGLISAR